MVMWVETHSDMDGRVLALFLRMRVLGAAGDGSRIWALPLTRETWIEPLASHFRPQPRTVGE